MDVNLRGVMLSFFAENVIIVLAITLVTYYLTRHWFDPKRKNLPPGPNGVPVLGYIPFIPADYGNKLKQLYEQYGKIFSMRLGSTDVVFISDFEVIKKITMRDVFNHRPGFSVFSIILPMSLVNCE